MMAETNPTLEELREFAQTINTGSLFVNKYKEEVELGEIQPGQRAVRLIAHSDRDELLEDWVVETVQHPYIELRSDDKGPQHVTSVATLFTRYNPLNDEQLKVLQKTSAASDTSEVPEDAPEPAPDANNIALPDSWDPHFGRGTDIVQGGSI